MTDPTPKYNFRYDADGNVLFLDYGGGDYEAWDYRMTWTRRNHSSQVDDWFLVMFPNHHSNALKRLPLEIEMAQRAFDEIMGNKIALPKTT